MSTRDVTELLIAWNGGHQPAFEELIARVYDELRQMARYRLARERPGHTLQPTALVHEVYLRIAGNIEIGWKNRAHFFGACANTMRRILVDHARKRQAQKRGGGATTVALDGLGEGIGARADHTVDLIALDEALNRLEAMDPRQSEIIELRFFAGLKIDEAAEVLGISPRTVKHEWTKARAWLFHQLREE
jgi:RNA polymerase sigma factor (TIGR02999 family)